MDKHEISGHFDRLAYRYDKWLRRNNFYHRCIQSLYLSIIPSSEKVLEIGCGTGELLAQVKPSSGTGIDLSRNMIAIARQKYPSLRFFNADIDEISVDELGIGFDYIIMSNLVDYLSDISGTLAKAGRLLGDNGLIIITSENPFWDPAMRLASKLRLRMPDIPRNFVTNQDLANLVELAGLKVVKMGLKFFVPVKIPFFSSLINFFVSECAFLRNFCLLQYLVVRHAEREKALSCSVIIPCYNESGNIAECIKRIPRIGEFTEIIVVDDGSSDNTRQVVEEIMRTNPQIKLISYPRNRGKGFAVKTGCDAAKADVLMILDADMSVRPEDLPKFFGPIQQGRADFVNGSRMIYPMQGQAMRALNYIGNRGFSIILSWLMEQHVSDTLCGTKAFLRKDYLRITMGRCRWGDFDLLFGFAKLNKKIVEAPVYYQKRVSGESKMRIVRHGLLLAKMCFIGFCEMKLFQDKAR